MNATLQARIQTLERDLGSAELGYNTFMDQRDAERKTVEALQSEIEMLKEDMKKRDESFGRLDIGSLKRQIEQLKFLRVKQTAENDKLKLEIMNLKKADRDFVQEKVMLCARHQEEVHALRKRIGSLEVVNQQQRDQDKDKALFQEAIRQHEALKRAVQELEYVKQSSVSTFDALASVAAVMNRANRRCTSKDVDELREQTNKLVRLAVAGEGLSAGELKQRQDAITSCFFTSFSHSVMRQVDERVDELKRHRAF